MKKIFDRYLFSRMGLQILFSVILILLFSWLVTVVKNVVLGEEGSGNISQALWGFRQFVDSGVIVETIDELDEIGKKNVLGVPVMMVVTLLAWLMGIVLCGFVTGAIVNAFDGRRDKIENGLSRYKFKNHGIVIGWDFQGVAAVMAMFESWDVDEVLVLSEKPSSEIRSELSNELGEKTMCRVFVYNGTLGTEVGIDELFVEKSRVVMVLGDRNEFDNDGGNLKIGALLRQKLGKELKKNPLKKGVAPIQIFIDISGTYNLHVAEMFPTEGYKLAEGVEVHIVNFCKSTVRELYSSFAQFVNWNSGRRKGVYETSYLPLSFRKTSNEGYAHIVIAGSGDMAKALALELSPLLGGGSTPGKVSMFSSNAEEMARFSAAFPFEKLQGVEVEFISYDIDSVESREILSRIVRNEAASVTIFITNDCADEACAIANRLPSEVRFENVRLMVEQRILSKWAHKTYPMKLTGFREVSFFGFLDRYLASCKERVLLSKEILSGANISGDRVRYFASSFVDGILENLASHGYRFEYNPGRKKSAILSLPENIISDVIRFEHARNVNFLLLHGVSAGTYDDDLFQTSTNIMPWSKCGEAVKMHYSERINNALGALERIYNTGDYPYVLERSEFRMVLGALPDESILETQEERKRVRNEAINSAIKETKIRTAAGAVKSPESIAFIMIPCKGLSRLLYRLSFLHSIPMILVLPKSRNEFVAEIEEESEREFMERWLRNAYSIVSVADMAAAERYIKDHSMCMLIQHDGKWCVKPNFSPTE